jgi:hypothetical protein
VTLGALSDYGGFIMDRAAPTSTVWLSSTGTTTSSLASVGWLDDASGIAQVEVAYQVDGGAWHTWRTFRPGYVDGEAALFGPTDPVTVNIAQHAYCFRSRATDAAGRSEPQHAAADACTSTTRRVYLPIIRK